MSRLRLLSGRCGGARALLVGFTLVPFFALGREAAGQACPAPQSPPACTENARSTAGSDVVDQWKCWQKSLRSTGYAGVNAYRDLELTVEIRKTSNNGLVRTGWGFWDCTEGGTTEVFRIRTALPAGTYKWEVKCQNRTGAPAGIKNCATDPNLNGPSLVSGGTASGTFNVTAKTGQNDRYDRGFLTLSTNRRFLKQGSTAVPFFWLGDTAWAASNKAARSGDWATYLETRKKQGFTTVLLVAAPHFGGVTPSQVFQQVAGCVSDGTKVPNNCSRWSPPYWQQLEAKIQDANAKGLLVMVTGLMEPFDYLDSANPYGSPTWLGIFARGLAARLAGHHVVLSPGMDDLFNTATRPLADAVGNAISQAAPAHLVTHHGGGSSNCTDYTSLLQTTSWHDFHVFQSGHCLNLKRNVNPGQELPCDPRRNYFPFNNAANPGPEDETAIACVTRRAQEMSSNLFSHPTIKPSVNGETVYDLSPANQASATAPENRQYVRHTAYLSALSGSFGFTYGANPVAYWNFTGANTLTAALGPVPPPVGTPQAAAAHSAWDMQRMASIFKARPWKEFVPEPTRIKNQPTASEKKMAYARSNNFTFSVAYLPNDPGQDRIRLDLSSLTPSFACGGASWLAAWQNPRSIQTVPAVGPLCQPVGSYFDFLKPSCPSGPCDWVLTVDRVGAKVDDSGDPVLQVWPEMVEGGSTIYAQALTPSGEQRGEPLVLSQSAEQIFRKQPAVTRVAGEAFVVVWESEDQDGSMFGIFGRRFDNLGQPLGEEFQVNTYNEHDQAEAWISAAPSGESVVVWMSFDQDGDLGGIFGQRYDNEGRPEGIEFQINTMSQGHQGSPLVGMDAQGGFVVAWESERQDGEGLVEVLAQRFDARGLPIGSELRISTDGKEGEQVLANLEVLRNGWFKVTWYDYDTIGNLLGLSSRQFDGEGVAVD
jgi:hypothetical protein